MENENVMESTPTDTTNIVNDDDFFAEVDDEVINETEEESQEGTEEETQPQSEDSKEPKEMDYSPLLKELSGKIKYNGESVEVDSTDNLIENYQKGLNYDKVKQQLNDLQNSRAFSYINRKAKELGISVDEYMNQVENYEKEQLKQKEADELEELISNGMPESLAKELIATRQLSKELQSQLSETKEEKKAQQEKAAKDLEYANFIENHKGIEIDKIPKEVFEKAETIGLENAYTQYENKELKKQIESLKLNEKNRKSSVGSTTQFGSEDETGEIDDFLLGFDSD